MNFDFDGELENARVIADPMEAPIRCVCDDCGGDIYYRNEYFLTEDGYTLCEDCMDKYLEDIKDTARQIAGEE